MAANVRSTTVCVVSGELSSLTWEKWINWIRWGNKQNSSSGHNIKQFQQCSQNKKQKKKLQNWASKKLGKIPSQHPPPHPQQCDRHRSTLCHHQKKPVKRPSLVFCLAVAATPLDEGRLFHICGALAGDGVRLFIDYWTRRWWMWERVVLLNHFHPPPPPPHTHTYPRRVILHVPESVRVVVNMFLCLVPGFHLRLPNTTERTFSSQPKCVRVTCFCSPTTCRDTFKWAPMAHGFYFPQLIVLTSWSGAWKEQRAKKKLSYQHESFSSMDSTRPSHSFFSRLRAPSGLFPVQF